MFPTKMLGFGMMRLPKKGDAIDIDATCDLVDRFLAHGYTYFDTAYVYEGSEEAVRKTVVERHPRESFVLADKLPYWNITQKSDVQTLFDESLQRCGVDYFDYYLLHCVRRDNLSIYEENDCFSWMSAMKKAGKIRYMGFSFHDTPELLDEVLHKHPEVDFVQLQLNYLDRENELVQSRGVHEVACRHGKPIVVMEPVKGGMLANLPEQAEAVLRSIHPDATPASWALRHVAGLDGVRIILSGMSDMAQVEDNLATLDAPVPLDEIENNAIDQVVKILHEVGTIPCTGCRYCVDSCPMGILIPDLIRIYNNGTIYGFTPRQKNNYAYHTTLAGHNPASACINCGKCKATCPQSLDVPDILKTIAAKIEDKEYT